MIRSKTVRRSVDRPTVDYDRESGPSRKTQKPHTIPVSGLPKLYERMLWVADPRGTKLHLIDGKLVEVYRLTRRVDEVTAERSDTVKLPGIPDHLTISPDGVAFVEW